MIVVALVYTLSPLSRPPMPMGTDAIEPKIGLISLAVCKGLLTKPRAALHSDTGLLYSLLLKPQ